MVLGALRKLAVGRLFDAGEADTTFGRALLQVRYRALQRQIPLLYLIALANALGFHLGAGLSIETVTHPINLLLLLVAARLVYWVRNRHRKLAPEAILVELRKTLLLASLFSAAGGLWASTLLFEEGSQRHEELLILFSSLAAIGCSYGLSSFPVAARMPILLFAVPFSLALIFSQDTAHIAVGISLILVSLLTLRLLDLQNIGFVQLVRSRSEIEIERERAQRAEQVALCEKARVKQVADTDPLTGLANRRAFLATLEARLADRGAPPFALALIDLDGFKPINDTFGHAAGDSVLIEVSTRLKREARAGTLVARIGGDEFALILPCPGNGAAIKAGERICALLGRPYPIDGREFRLSACCGLIMLEPGDSDVTAALVRGDAALYHGKQRGRGCVALFTPELEKANERRTAIERALREPTLEQQIGVAYQPIFDLATGELRAFEALARWAHPQLGQIGPSEFIPITEQINAIEAISGTLLSRAAAEAARWPVRVHLSFNLSAVELHSATSAGRILQIVEAQGLDPARLQVEVTETALLADFDTARLNLEALRSAGARIVLDDFGAGYASIAYLREMAFDAIKLDGALVTGALGSPPALRLLRGVLDLCGSLGVPCVAEHIEQAEQVELLRSLNCRDGQGFALSPPLGAAEAGRLAKAEAPIALPSAVSGRRHAA